MTTKTNITLPPLPDPRFRVDAGSGGSVGGYSADQMRAYARAAVEAVLQSDKIKAMDGMASCMDMVRRELIEAGIITKQVAPMFVANAVLAEIQALRKDAARIMAAIPPPWSESEGYVPYSEGGQSNQDAFADGWNGCRDKMIEMQVVRLRRPM